MELFALDLGNRQTKMKSRKAEKVFSSFFVNADDYGDRSFQASFGGEQTSHDYTSPKFNGNIFVWGEAIDYIGKITTKTLMFENRYASEEFMQLAEMALGELAKDFKEAQGSSILEVHVVTGVPTNDYMSLGAMASLSSALNGQHTITIDDVTYNVKVLETSIIPQSVGTIINEVSDDLGNPINNEITTSNIGVIDCGGGTVLIDALNKMALEVEARDQMENGAYTIYEAVQRNLSAKRYRISDEEIEASVKSGNEKETYTWSPDGTQVISITEEVMKHRKSFTRKVASRAKTTYKGFDRLKSVLITGGAANLIVKDEFLKTVPKAKFVKDSEFANVRGFYKYGLAQGVVEGG